jgi:hypothetical protein
MIWFSIVTSPYPQVQFNTLESALSDDVYVLITPPIRTRSYLCFHSPCKPDFHCALIPCTWSGHWFWLRTFPFTWMYCGWFCSTNLNLTTDIWVWNRDHGGCDRSAGDAHSSAVPDPSFAFVGGLCTQDSILCLLFGLWLRLTHC